MTAQITKFTQKNVFMVKPFERKIIGKTWVIYYDENKGKKTIEKSSLLYQIYTPKVVLGILTLNVQGAELSRFN